MTEVFKPRENMLYNTKTNRNRWECRNKQGLLVCDGGPSLIYSDHKWAFYDSNIGFHRLHGPAFSEGEWFIHGRNLTKEIHQFAFDNSIDIENLTDEDKVLIALTFG